MSTDEKSLLAMAKAAATVLKGDALSVAKLRRRAEVCDLESEEFFELLKRLEDAGIVSPIGEAKSRYAVAVDRLNEFIARLEAPETPATTPAPAPSADSADSADGAPTPAPAPEPAKVAAPVGEAAPKVKLTRWEKVMAQIAAVPVTKLTEAEKAMAIDDAFARMCEVVVEANKAITALATKTDLVDGDVDLLDITRVMPENGKGTGGARITYSAGTGRRGAKVLLDVPWEAKLTRKGLDRQVRKVEDRVFDTISRMADYVAKHSK